MIAPRVGQRRQSGVSRLGSLKAWGLSMKEVLLDGFPFTVLCCGDAGLGALHGGLRRYHQPALGHAVVTQLGP